MSSTSYRIVIQSPTTGITLNAKHPPKDLMLHMIVGDTDCVSVKVYRGDKLITSLPKTDNNAVKSKDD